MRKTLIIGLACAIVSAILLLAGSGLGLGQSSFALLGLGTGAALGLIPLGAPGLRAAAWLVGFIVACLGHAVWSAVLPDSGLGRAVAVFIAVAAIAVIASVSQNVLPLWAQLLGSAAAIGAYRVDPVLPTAFSSELVSGATTVALGAALGFLTTSVADQLIRPAPDLSGPGRSPGSEGAVEGLPQPRQESAPTSAPAQSGVETINQMKSGA